MAALKRRLSERCLDVCDWLDYAPDADFRPLLALPVLFAFGWVYGGPFGVEALATVALFVTLAVALVALVVCAGWIVANAALDVLARPLSAARARVCRPSQPQVPVPSRRTGAFS